MDKIQLLQARKAKITEASKEIREEIKLLTDEKSFVELSAFSFSKNEFYGQDISGEGVVTGFATINGYPFYIIAQNFEILSGGVSQAHCDKIVKCLDTAEKNATPVIYLLNSLGVQTGEGVTVLEGLAKVLFRSSQLKGVVPQYAVINGEVYGSISMLSAIADFTFFINKKSVLAINSPFVLSAKAGKNLAKEEVGGIDALDKTCISALKAENIEDVKQQITEISELLDLPEVDAELNDSVPELNETVDLKNLMKIFETSVEIGANSAPEVKTLLGRIGGISVAAVIFDSKDNGVELNATNVAKIKYFAEFASSYNIPFLTFTDVKGLRPTMCVNNSRVMKEMTEYLEVMDTIDVPKIAVVYKQAVGLGYSLFAAKSAGFDYTCAFANAKIALFDSVQGAQIELADEKADKAALEEKYSDENSDPVNAAKNGYVDAIIEPQFVKQYVVSALQMLDR